MPPLAGRVFAALGILLAASFAVAPTVAAPTTLDATFDPRPGNEWWVESAVRADNPVVRLEARVDGGVWHDLEQRRWGAWAASFHVPTGSVVEFRASDDFGGTATSGQYVWPDATPRHPDAPAFAASFAPEPGNEWWVEAVVEGNQALATVEARVDGGTWQTLTLREWGAWAGSFHVPDGSLVEFRATSAEGDHDLSEGYVWPDAQPAA